jgi:phosphatidate cytidylyltransferase
MIKRIATAAFGIPIVYCAVTIFSPFAFFMCVGIIVAVSLDEFCRMALPVYTTKTRACICALGFLLVSSGFADMNIYKDALLFPGPVLIICCCLILAMLFVYHIVRSEDLGSAFYHIAVTFLGLWYIAILFSYVMVIRERANGVHLLFFLLFLTWAGDIGAYIIGSWKGKTPLAARISPKKTIEGAIGSIVCSFLTAIACRALFFHTMSYGDCFVVTLCVNILNQFGDLSESLIKRASGISESGSILPGHGGMLDRIDSLLFAAPFVYYYAHYMSV